MFSPTAWIEEIDGDISTWQCLCWGVSLPTLSIVGPGDIVFMKEDNNLSLVVARLQLYIVDNTRVHWTLNYEPFLVIVQGRTNQ